MNNSLIQNSKPKTQNSFRIFLFVLIFSPLAFGTVELWSYTVMEIAVFSGFLFLLVDMQARDKTMYKVPGIVPLVLFLVYILFQLVPLPSGVVSLLSPVAYEMYSQTVGAVDPVSWMCLTINKKATLTEFFSFSACVIFYVLTVQLLTKKELLKKTVAVVIIFASILALVAILQRFTADGKIFWLREAPSEMPFGPYVNRNHYAGFMGMIFPVVFCIFLFYRPETVMGSFRERLYSLLNQYRTNIYIFLGCGAILIATSIFVSLSRGGIISLCLSSVLLLLMLFLKRDKDRKSVVPFIIIFLILLFVGWIGWEPVFKRFDRMQDDLGQITANGRLLYWEDINHIIGDFPMTGSGFGTLVDIYPSYRTFKPEAVLRHAHNDYLELLTDGGVIASFLFACFLVTLFRKTFKTFGRRKEKYSIYLYLGSIGGIIYLLIHSNSDFNLHIGANRLYFFFLCGLAVSAANTRLRRGLKDTKLKKTTLSSRYLLGIPTAALVLSCLVFNAQGMIGKYYFSSIEDTILDSKTTKKDLLAAKETAYKASMVDPLEAVYCFAMGNTELLLSNLLAAKDYYIKALGLTPANGEYLQRLGLLLSALEENKMADKMLYAGVKRDINNPERYRLYASWLLSGFNSSGFNSQGDKKESEDKKRGIEIIQKAIYLDPRDKNVDKSIAIMIRSGMNEKEIKDALPKMVDPYIYFGEYLETTGMDEMARDVYLETVEFAKKQEDVSRRPFLKAYSYFMKKKQLKNALEVMLEAIEVLPDDAHIRFITGGLYERMGIIYRAKEEYQKTLLINPEYKRASDRLERLKDKKLRN